MRALSCTWNHNIVSARRTGWLRFTTSATSPPTSMGPPTKTGASVTQRRAASSGSKNRATASRGRLPGKGQKRDHAQDFGPVGVRDLPRLPAAQEGGPAHAERRASLAVEQPAALLRAQPLEPAPRPPAPRPRPPPRPPPPPPPPPPP